MAEVVGDYDDDPIPPRPRRDDDYSPFDVDEEETQPQQPQQQQQQQQQPLQINEAQPSAATEEQEQRLSRTETNTTTSSPPREATELEEIRRLSTESTSEGSLSSGEYRVPSRQSGTTTITTAAGAGSQETRNRQKKQNWVPDSVRRFWARNVTLEVPHKGNRDYFGMDSTRKNIPSLHAHRSHILYPRRPRSPTLSSPIFQRRGTGRTYIWYKFQVCRYPAQRCVSDLRDSGFVVGCV
ncbi:hypothetical protein TCE0_013r00920 [Talaromyces pinophilus]|uniref:Uncharacterized protein n=1 Tax=Talaromyces pinophilus TaxID=128442 RepID=A0A698XLV8_TALPI|nr:hypothetical protein TCE0_013r00920 [Talaromyces pinophilus]